MIKKESRNEMRKARHARVREKVVGTKECPRLNVFRSNKNIFAQIIDDETNATLVSASSIDKEFECAREKLPPSSQKIHPPLEIVPSRLGQLKPASRVIL